MKKLLILIAALIISNSCQKDDYSRFWELKYECSKSLNLSCEGITSEQYFYGKINGKEFCISDGTLYVNKTSYYTRGTSAVSEEIDPQNYSGVGFSFRFEPQVDPNLSTTTCEGILDNDLIPLITLKGPSLEWEESLLPPMKLLFDKFISVGKKEFFVSRKQNGWKLSAVWTCGDETYYEGFDRKTDCIQGFFSSGLRKGHENESSINISEVKITETPFNYIYDITIEINADLFSLDKYADSYFYGRLEDGIFKHRAFVEK